MYNKPTAAGELYILQLQYQNRLFIGSRMNFLLHHPRGKLNHFQGERREYITQIYNTRFAQIQNI